MRPWPDPLRRLALAPVAIALALALGLAAEWLAYDDGVGFALAAADYMVGALFLVGGALAWRRRRESRVGALMLLTGGAWFAGTAFAPALYLHRGPLVHLLLSYPSGRLPTRIARAVALSAYAVSAIEPLASMDEVSLALAAAVALAAAHGFLHASAPARTAKAPAFAAGLAFAAVLALGALVRMAGSDADGAILWAYDAVLACTAAALVVDLLRGRWADAVVTGLVVDLGDEARGSLRGKLAKALGDPSLVVAYRLPDTGSYVDDRGVPVALPAAGSGRAVTAVGEGDEQVAVLVHDEGLLADQELLDAVAAAARIAVANVRLQVEARERARDLEASRRRIVEAADAQRRRLEEELRLGVESRLDRVAGLLSAAHAAAGSDDARETETLEAELARTRDELREFAHGVHPAALTELGLGPALALLAQRSPVPTTVSVDAARLPAPLEAALFFVCSEALANTAKHASASHATIDVSERNGRVVVEVADDGSGGADPTRGSGLAGLADRLDAVGGRLTVESAPSSGTRVVAEVPREGRL